MSWFRSKKNAQSIALQQNIKNKSVQQLSQQVSLNIEGIQKFYKLNSQKKLIDLILDKKQSERLFSTFQIPQSQQKKIQHQQQQAKLSYFASKYTFQALVEKFPKPKSGTNNLLLKILQKKLQKEVITSHQTRKSIWLLASGAKFNMINNKDLYEGLLYYTDYPPYFQRSIIQDLHRTVNRNTSLSVQQDVAKLRNVLMAFSRRNPYIGYCQGLNFIVFFILTMQFTQEQAFFLLTTMLEHIIPMDYYTNMIGVVCDQQIFVNCLKVLKPNVVWIQTSYRYNGSSVCSPRAYRFMYQFYKIVKLVKIVWDRLLVQGTRAFIKAGLIIISYFEDSLLTTTQFHEIIMILEKGTKNLQVPQVQFNAQFQKYYIDKKGLKIARDLYRQYHIKQKLQQKVNQKRGKDIQVKCNTKWPICALKLQKLKRQREEPDVWIYRSQNPPKIIHDYLSNKSSNFQKYMKSSAAFYSSNQKSTKKSTRQIMDKINMEATYFTEQDQKQLRFNNQNINNLNNSDNVFYEITLQKKPNTKSSDNRNDGQVSIKIISSINSQPSLIRKQPKKSGDLIIGRMQHICQKNSPQKDKSKKSRKTDIKFISLIYQDQSKDNLIKQFDQLKRAETYKKMKNVFELIAEQSSDNLKENQTKIEVNNINQQQNGHKIEQRNLLARSRTINFYNQFIEKNKQLSGIISGIEAFSPQKARYEANNYSQLDNQRFHLLQQIKFQKNDRKKVSQQKIVIANSNNSKLSEQQKNQTIQN